VLFAGDDFPGPDRTLVERHVKRCPACQALLAAHEATLSVLHAAGAAEPVDSPEQHSLWPALEQRLRDSRRPESLRNRDRLTRWRTVRVALAGLAAAALIAGTIWVAPTARQYRVSVTVDRLPRVRIHRVSNPRGTLASPPARSARRASFIREIPAQAESAEQSSPHP
jgi:anti-sigma factor RsiW